MFYLDEKKTVTRRDSSLIISGEETPNTGSTFPLADPNKRRSVQNELVTWMFESMLPCIVESWELIEQVPKAPSIVLKPVEVPEEKKKKGKNEPIAKTPSSRFKLNEGRKIDESKEKLSMCQAWWSSPDERAIIRFKNGNLYEGDISQKLMHGVGRFQWSDGTVYMGHFDYNEIKGYGTIYFKDDTWYDGFFDHNLRHGKGLFVDSRQQRSYAGHWHHGMKDGHGRIIYSRSMKNIYQGSFSKNVRHGYGTMDYGRTSGYMGMWNENKKDGQGIMIWPNTDFYLGNWESNTMSGFGVYIWNNYYNCTMVAPCLKIYRGTWKNGVRNDYGQIRFGTNLGAIYQGNYVDNKKDGNGKIMTTNGRIYKDKNLFIDDVGIYQNPPSDGKSKQVKQSQTVNFDICEENFALITYHVQHAIENVRKAEDIVNAVDAYLRHNKVKIYRKQDDSSNGIDATYLEELAAFEEYQLQRVIKYYEPCLRDLYKKYASICCDETFYFEPFLLRLYLWQFFYDCNVHQHKLTLYDIDVMFYKNSKLCAIHPHDPFEKLFFWQFLHLVVVVASKLYAKKSYPGPRPDTIVASALMTFMNNNVIPCTHKEEGKLRQEFGQYIPLRATYNLYLSIGEPHDIPTFLKAIRGSKHFLNAEEVPVIDMPNSYLPVGRNAYTHAGEMMFLVDKIPEDVRIRSKYKLFNIANVPTRKIMELFGHIFPEVSDSTRTLNTDFKLTFFEFFEVFVGCIEESILLEINCRFE